MPWITLTLAAVALVVQLVPGAPEALAIDRAASGEDWRWWTGHLAHFSWNHLGWDLAVFVTLGSWLERRDRARTWVLLHASALAIAAAFVVGLPELATYRGLSGLDAALFAGVAVELWRTSSGRERCVPGTLAALLIGKVAYEIVTGHTLFADDAAFTPVPLAHAVGGGIGALVWRLYPPVSAAGPEPTWVQSA